MTTVLSLIDAHYLIDTHPFLDVKQSMKIDLRSDAKMQQSRRYNY